MSSLFSFLSDTAAADEPAAGEASSTPLAFAAAAATLPVFMGKPDMTVVLAQLVDTLRPFLPSAVSGLPEPNVTVASVTQRPLAIGNFRGVERRGAFSTAALKGGRLEAVLTFQLWANGSVEVDTAMDDLQGLLLAGRDELRPAGFLQFEAEGQGLAEFVTGVNAWRKTADFRVLFEYHYYDDDGALSLITRIPVEFSDEQLAGQLLESMVITGRVVRWDDLTTPELLVRGRTTVRSLLILAYVPGPAPSDSVRLQRTYAGASAPPAVFTALADFLTAVGGNDPAETNAEITFSTLADFLAEFSVESTGFALGDLEEDGTIDTYESGSLVFPAPISLTKPDDIFRLSYQADGFGVTSAMYLQVN